MKIKPIPIIASIIVLVVFLFFVGVFQMSAILPESKAPTLQIPANERYSIEPRSLSISKFGNVKFGDYEFKPYDYSTEYQAPFCEKVTGYDCQEISYDEKYDCTKYSCRYITQPRSCSCPSNCFACACISCLNEGIGSKCSQSDWERYSCRNLNTNVRREEGGLSTNSFRGAGFRWNLEHLGNNIGSQTEFKLNDLNYWNGEKFCNNLFLKEGKIYCEEVENYEYNLRIIARGSNDENNNPFVRLQFRKNIPENSINSTINIKESFVKGEEANIKLEVCNELNEFKGLLETNYKFKTFLGDIEATDEKEINIPSGCSEHLIEFSTEESTSEITVTPKLRVYEKGYTGVLIDRETVLGKEEINYDKVVLSINDYVLIASAEFEQSLVTITSDTTKNTETKQENNNITIALLITFSIFIIIFVILFVKRK